MLTIIIRTLLIYVILIGTMRLMGKRQLGELEISDLVTTLLLSEIAAIPIENQEIPIMYAVIPIITLLTLEVILSVILMKCPKLKNLASARPNIIINKGKLNQKELTKIRISLDELISELRQSNISDISEVEYAILEQNGKITVIPKASSKPPSAEQLGLDIDEPGIMHMIIADGKINSYNLKLLGIEKASLYEMLEKKHLDPRHIFLLTMDDSGKMNIIMKEKFKK